MRIIGARRRMQEYRSHITGEEVVVGGGSDSHERWTARQALFGKLHLFYLALRTKDDTITSNEEEV